MLSKKNIEKVINYIKEEVKEGQPLNSIKLSNHRLKKFFFEKKDYFYFDEFGDGQIYIYYTLRSNTLGVIKYLDFSDFNFTRVLLDDNEISIMALNDEQLEQVKFTAREFDLCSGPYSMGKCR